MKITSLSLIALFTILFVVFGPFQTVQAAGAVWYASPVAKGSGSCSSWVNACTLTSAISKAATGDSIWVQAGTHLPGSLATDHFGLRSGVRILGGFNGSETAETQRNPATRVTILSGGGARYNVVVAISVDSTALLDGFTITGGKADSYFASGTSPYGGGIHLDGSSPVLSNLIITGNYALQGGGGIFNNKGNPTFINVIVHKNTTDKTGGGGMFSNLGVPQLHNVTFHGNISNTGAAGGLLAYSKVQAWNSIFWNNGTSGVHGSSLDNSTLSYSITDSACPISFVCNHILNANPQFADAAGGNFRLNATSPAIDAGDSAQLPADKFDLDGDLNTTEPWPYDLAVSVRRFDYPALETGVGQPVIDMGAYEAYDSSPFINPIDDAVDYNTPTASYIPFFVSDGDTNLVSLTFSMTSNNPALLPQANMQVLGTGNRRDLKVQSLPSVYGSTIIGITVSDGTKTFTRTFRFSMAQSAPKAVTGAAMYVSNSQATLSGTANAIYSTTTVSFEYGLDTTYGTSIEADPKTIIGNFDVPLRADIVGLLPGTTYHYRAVAANGVGTGYGSDQTFTTGCGTNVTVINASDNSVGSLRWALNAACPGGTVYFSNSLANGTIYLDSGELSIDKPLTLFNQNATNLAISGWGTTRVLHVMGTGNVKIYNLRLIRGQSSNYGGGIYLEKDSRLTLYNSALLWNYARTSGGAIYNNQGTLTLVNSTVAENNAPEGAFLYNLGTVNIYNSTIANNSSSTGQTINAAGGMLTMNNTLMGNNSGGDCSGSLTGVNQNNLFESANTCGLVNGVNGNVVGKDPVLGVLGTYNGVVNTLPLLPGSPAIDAGNGTVCSNPPVSKLDQRSAVRPFGAACDIGAFESQGFSLSLVSGSDQSAALGSTFANPLVVALSSPFGDPVDGAQVTFSGPSSGPGADPVSKTATVSGGKAVTTFKANDQASSYTVTAEGKGFSAGTVPFTLNNILPTVTLSASSNSASEAGSTVITLTATLSAPAVSTQTVSVSVSGASITTGDYALGASSFLFLTGQSSITIQFTVINDQLDEDLETAVVTLYSPSSKILLGSTISQSITIADNDTRGVTVTASDGSTQVVEGGATDTYTVVLKTEPIGSVTIHVSAGAQVEVRTGSNPYAQSLYLTFNDLNWATPQTVEVRAVVDGAAGDSYTETITHPASGGDYAGVTVNPMIVSISAPPSASTQAATGVTANNATLHGVVSAGNAVTTVTFQYGLTTAYGATISASPSAVTGSANTDVSNTLTGLIPNSTYHYRVAAVNSAGTRYSADQTFTTLKKAPTAETYPPSYIEATSATIAALVNANNDSTAVSFEYGLTTAYGTTIAALTTPLTGAGTHYSYGTITPLQPNTTYHYRVKATNSTGTTYGLDVSFTSPKSAPAATTGGATGVFSKGATLNGTVNPKNDSTTVRFEYGPNTSYGHTVTAGTLTGMTDTAVSIKLTGLTANATYHYRVVATNGTGITYGADKTVTLDCLLGYVTNTSDIGPGSLRTTLDEICSGGTIYFDASLANQTIRLTSGQLTISKSITLDNQSAPNLAISGENSLRVFYIFYNASLTVNHLRIMNGRADIGGGILILPGGQLILQNSVLSGNKANVHGGAIVNQSGTLILYNSTITGSEAESVAVLLNDRGTATVKNSTIVGNSSPNMPVISNNGSLTLTNTLMGNNVGGDCDSPSYTGVSMGASQNNLLESTASHACNLTNGVDGNITGKDPLLGSLGDYGGNTLTLPLLPGSPAIDAGIQAACLASPINNIDQRGIARTFGAACDIGAYESRGFNLAYTGGNNQSALVGSAFASPLAVTVSSSYSEPVNDGMVNFIAPATGAGTNPTSSTAAITGGAASAMLIANGQAGSYTVQAVASGYGGSPIPFTLTNTLPTVRLSASANSGSEATSTVITLTAITSAPVYGDQTLTVTVSGIGITTNDYTLSSATLTIPAGQTSGSVTFTVLNDALYETGEIATVTLSSPSSRIALGSPFSQSITIADDDIRGLLITKSGGSTQVVEGGSTDTYTITLTSQPTAAVLVKIIAGTQTQIRIIGKTFFASSADLTIIPTEWNIPVTVEVRAVDDAADEGEHSEAITHRLSGGYTGLPDVSLTVAISDNDAVSGPTAVTDAATGVTASGATLHGTVSAGNADTTVTFEYGLDATYGTTVTAEPGMLNGQLFTSVSKTLTGLSPSTKYYYRLAATNRAGTAYGADLTFTTGSFPTVNITSTVSSPTHLTVIPVIITFSKPVIIFTVDDLVIENGSVDGFAGSGEVYTVNLIPTADGAMTLNIPANAAIDAQGNGNSVANPFTLIVDAAVLKVTIKQAQDQADPTHASPIRFIAVFSKPIDGTTFGPGDLNLGGSAPGALVGSITEIAPNDAMHFEIAVSGMSGSGTVSASISANAVNALAGNLNTASLSTDNEVTYDVDPLNVSTLDLKALYSGPGPASFTIRFNKPVFDPEGDTAHDDVTNPANYVLIEKGLNGLPNTLSCSGGLRGDDLSMTVTSVTYNAMTSEATGILPTVFPEGAYRLFICGSTSIVDLAGNHLGNGMDYLFDFKVGPVPTGVLVEATSALSRTDGVEVSWQTAQELDLFGFSVYRSESLEGGRLLLTPDLILPQSAGMVFGATYHYMDKTAEPGKAYDYWIEAVYRSGSTVFGPLERTWNVFLPFTMRK